MQTLNDLLYNFAIFIKRYPVVYFSFAGLILLSMLIYLIKDRFKEEKTIKKIKSLLLSNPEKAFNILMKSELPLIEYFTRQENLNGSEYIKIKQFLTGPEKVREIYKKVIMGKEKDRLQRIKHGVSIMANLGTPQAVDYLITFLYEDDREIIRMILAYLENIQAEKVIYSLIEYIRYIEDNDILNNLMETLKGMGEEAVKRIIPLVYKADPATQICYINIIGEYIKDESYQVLVDILDTDNSEVKFHVLQKLANYKLDDEVIDKIIKNLDDEHWGVKSQAVNLLGKKKIMRAAPYIARKLNDESGIVRATATEALMNLGYKGIKYIFELAKDPDAPKEVKDALKEQDIAFIIEAMERVYQRNNAEAF